jgi:hypothetical protein
MTPSDLTTLRKRCACCGGTGRVLSATGEMRPCSRCNDAYEDWAKDYFRPASPSEAPDAA